MAESAHHHSIERPYNNEQMIQISHAAEGYKAAHPNASQEEIDAFVLTVSNRIYGRQPRPRISKEERKQRRAAVLEKIKANGLKTASVRMARSRFLSSQLSPTGGINAAYKVADGQLTIAASICSLKDNFDGLDGRERAVQRFIDGITLTMPGSKIEDIDPLELDKRYKQLLRDRKAA